jgi:arginine repressor
MYQSEIKETLFKVYGIKASQATISRCIKKSNINKAIAPKIGGNSNQ